MSCTRLILLLDFNASASMTKAGTRLQKALNASAVPAWSSFIFSSAPPVDCKPVVLADGIDTWITGLNIGDDDG
jgi:hypothetical protein